MLARWLRLGLGLEIAVLFAVALLLVREGGWSPAAASGFFVAGFLLVSSAPILAAYVITLVYRRRTGVPAIGVLRALRGLAGEWLSVFALFGLLQPFERWWMGADTVGAVGGRRSVVLLVHGYVCNRGQWWWMRRRLRAGGFAVATINLEPPLADIDHFADLLRERIEALLGETGVERLALVAHSMGGLVARAYLRRHGSARVSTLITLVSPHGGTVLAYLGPGRDARQMQPGSDWLRHLAEQESFGVPVLSLGAGLDEIVVPQEGSRLAGARNKTFATLGHLSMLFSAAVLRCVQSELERPGSPQ